jgi:hypothetical protein
MARKKTLEPDDYSRIIEAIFLKLYKKGATNLLFDRDDLVQTAKKLGLHVKNIGDIVYSFRYRKEFPDSLTSTAPKGKNWIIRAAGQAKYEFVLTSISFFVPSTSLSETKIPNATPGIIEAHALSDEQALLAKVRYNRLIDIFTGVTCYSLQNHLRTNVPRMGQAETDEVYVGIDKKGVQYVIPVQAKSAKDKLGVVQIEQDLAICELKFPNLIIKPIGAQFIKDDLIALFEFESSSQGIKIANEKHYRLVDPNEISADDLKQYNDRS